MQLPHTEQVRGEQQEDGLEQEALRHGALQGVSGGVAAEREDRGGVLLRRLSVRPVRAGEKINTKGSALVIPLSPPRARERGAEELHHTPKPRLFLAGARSRVRSARASVRRNGGAVPTSRERGP